jgi:hypothetical protein
MKSGILVQHGHSPIKKSGEVRSDILAIIGFVSEELWPEDVKRYDSIGQRSHQEENQEIGIDEEYSYQTEMGDYVEMLLFRENDLYAHPFFDCVDGATTKGVQNFFANGGKQVHVFGVCIQSMEQLSLEVDIEIVFGRLLDHLRSDEDIALICSPALAYLPVEMDRYGEITSNAENFYRVLLSHCYEMNNRFAILDAPYGLHDIYVQKWVRSFRENVGGIASYGAIYYPWLCYRDETFPPSASMAGLFVRVEQEHPPQGIQWPPANYPLIRVTHLENEMDWSEAERYVNVSINPILSQSGRGIVPLGARTLSQEPAFQFINTRRILNLIIEQVRRDNQWAVFETNNTHLWSVLQRDIRYRLGRYWSEGLLTASTGGEKYRVQCDELNNPMVLRDAGLVNIEIRVQPVGAVEQIVIDLNIGGT